MLTHFPGALSVSFQIEPFDPFDRHGLQCAFPKMQDMQIRSQCLSFENFFLILPLSAKTIIAGKGR